MKTLLFICSGNTCRSPLALAAWQALERENPLTDWTAQSAGIMASVGAMASQHAQTIANSWGVDLRTHCSHPLTEDLAQNAARIITMTGAQAELVRAQFPESEVDVLGRYILSQVASDSETSSLESLLQAIEMGDGPVDISDPFGGSFDDYEVCARQIKDAVAALQESLRMESM